jgi:hypothetical protein
MEREGRKEEGKVANSNYSVDSKLNLKNAAETTPLVSRRGWCRH